MHVRCRSSAWSSMARNDRDWHTLLEFYSVVGVLLIDAEAVYDPGSGHKTAHSVPRTSLTRIGRPLS